MKQGRKYMYGCLRWKGNCAESSTIITCQREEIVPLKQGRLLPMTNAYFHPHTPPLIFLSTHTHTLSLSSLLPSGIHFLFSIHMSVLPSTILPLQIYSGIWNEILSHFRLVLNAFIQNEACENDFHRGAVRAGSLLTCRLYTRLSPLSLTHITWPDLSDGRVHKLKGGGKEVTD